MNEERKKILIISDYPFYKEMIKESLELGLTKVEIIIYADDLRILDSFLDENRMDFIIIDQTYNTSIHLENLIVHKLKIIEFNIGRMNSKFNRKKINFLEWLIIDRQLTDLVLRIKSQLYKKKDQTNSIKSLSIRKRWWRNNIIFLFIIHKLSPLKNI